MRTLVLAGAGPAVIPGAETIALDELMAGDAGAPTTGPEQHEPACVLLTSGTTGPSKAVLVSWRQFYQQATGGPPMARHVIGPGAAAPLDPPPLEEETDHAIYTCRSARPWARR